MIRVNLLPKEIYAAKARRQWQTVGGALGALVAAGLVAYYASLVMTSTRLDRDLAAAQTELQKYEAIDAEVKRLQAQESQLSSRLSVIQQLLRGTLTYPKFFEDFIALLPGDVWVTSLGTTTDASYGLQVAVSAQSLSPFAIADWLTNLLNSPRFTDPRLGAISVSEQGEGQSAIYQFTMNVNYRRQD